MDAVAGTSDGRVTERNKEKEEFIDAAVAKFQDVLLNGSFVQATAQMVQKQLEVNQHAFERDAQKEKIPVQGKEKTFSKDKNKLKNTNGKLGELNSIIAKASNSELTVYKNAVENLIQKRVSSSSEEDMDLTQDFLQELIVPIDTSDELEMDSDENVLAGNKNESLINQFIADARECSMREHDRDRQIAAPRKETAPEWPPYNEDSR